MFLTLGTLDVLDIGTLDVLDIREDWELHFLKFPMSVKWFCPNCNLDFSKPLKHCKDCKEMTHFRCLSTQLTGRHQNYFRHRKNCAYCGLREQKISRKRKEVDSLLAHEKSNKIKRKYLICFIRWTALVGVGSERREAEIRNRPGQRRDKLYFYPLPRASYWLSRKETCSFVIKKGWHNHVHVTS